MTSWIQPCVYSICLTEVICYGCSLALILASVSNALAQTGGDLYAVIINVAVNAWMAGHLVRARSRVRGGAGCSRR